MNSQAHLSATTVENISQQTSTKPRQTRSRKTPPSVNKALAIVDTLIIGAGFAGLGSAIRLKQAGLENLLIIERSDKVGGTWRDNTYPGAACDIPSNLYSYSFAQNPNWSRGFSNSSEILGYIHYLVDHFKLSNLIKFNHNVSSLSFDEQTGLWTVALADGEFYQARTIISAAGPLSNFSFPKIAGLENFKGKKIHSANWDHDYKIEGKRVAVIGTGASAIQIIPELVKTAEFVKVFQRTPGWVTPRPDYKTPEWNKIIFRKLPATQTAMRKALYWTHESMALAVIWNSPLTKVAEQLAKSHLKRQVKDVWLRRQLTPDFKIGCKRVLVSNDYYPALQQPNCKLITWPIVKITEHGVQTMEGVEHVVDCIVFATGFDVSKSGTPFPITGINNRNLAEEWSRGAQAYKSINVSGFPNLFFTFGPNSGPGHNSALVYMESQIDHAIRLIKTIIDQEIKVLDVKPEIQAEYNQKIQKRLTKTNWNSGCKSWYLTEDGFNSTMYPGFATQYQNQMKNIDLSDYSLIMK
ncbi:flavin-containing monooxygenase [Aquirhabdus parva]|uniref:NAD(P)/FAD-dependent oxidoreductase n=1 Tax=Aquirhabdus parva TaxID=2283318 RepID=A0A345P4C9_9GAMM|nr:NAD(P)/FAD-dependent oxidoreductase [Aquirhabdus parva]AXI02138.1 NAD(P)/FAD-dependent oxidoreductase [Aquirhabdus parva]